MSSLVSQLTFILPLPAALGVSWGLTAYLSCSSSRLCILDHPNERSLHQIPVSRTGGLAILAGLGTSLVLAAIFGHLGLGLIWPMTGAVLIALVSFFDDRAGVGVGVRFAVHFTAALLALAGGLAVQAIDVGTWYWAWPGAMGLVFSLLFLVWMTNLYNFMDGMDGFAGGMGLAGFGFLGLFGWLAGNAGYALVCWSTALACSGFLYFNFPPAKIFMGDTGASTLGFLAATMILWADRQGLFPLWAGMLVFSPFIADATVTLLRRLLSGERVWQAHRTHFYQRLVQIGWGHRKTVLVEYALMLAAGFSTLALLHTSRTVWPMLGLLAWGVLYVMLALGVGHMERGNNSA